MDNLPLVIGAVLGAGGIGALLRARSENRQNNADADVTLGAGWQVLWESARKDTAELRERLAVVEHREEECRVRLAQLESHSSPASIERVVATMLNAEISRRVIQ